MKFRRRTSSHGGSVLDVLLGEIQAATISRSLSGKGYKLNIFLPSVVKTFYEGDTEQELKLMAKEQIVVWLKRANLRRRRDSN